MFPPGPYEAVMEAPKANPIISLPCFSKLFNSHLWTREESLVPMYKRSYLLPSQRPETCKKVWWGGVQLYICSLLCWTARSIAQIEVLFPTLLEKLFWWFQWSRGSNLWPNNTVNTKFCVKIFLGARMSQPPQNALYHTVQMVLVDPCDRLISRFS